MICPSCGADQDQPFANKRECYQCGIVFARFQEQQSRRETGQAPLGEPTPWLERLLDGQNHLFIEQHARHWWEILLNWEQANEYMIRDAGRRNVGIIFENSTGFFNALVRTFLGSHRPLDVKVIHFQSDELALSLHRDFFFLFSDLEVVTPEGRRMGSVHRRFGFLYKRYDLLDERGNLFARISSPFWRLWTFPIFDKSGEEVAVITKRWTGLLKEMYTDADNFTVDFGKKNWSLSQKAVVFAAALSIDFDFFENNHQ